jgi:hypothetical protein
MSPLKTFFPIAVACCVAYPWQCLAAEEEIKYPSPDGKFALRITESPEDGERKIALIDRASGKVMIDLSPAWGRQVLMWSADSKWAAYGYGGDKWGQVNVYFWNGSSFEKAALPEDLPSPDIKVPEKTGSFKKYGVAVTPLHWLKSGELELSSNSMMLDFITGATYTGELRFTLAFGPQHHASINNVGKTKTDVAQQQEKPPARSVSPDGKWEFRAGAAGEQDDFVIAKAGSVEASVVLSEAEYVDGLAEMLGRRPSYANIVWAPDSKRFAYNLHPAKAYQTVQFYQLDGNTWRKLDALESNDATTAPLERSMARQKKKLNLRADWPFLASWQVRKWIDSSTALLYAHEGKTVEVTDETEAVSVSFFFTLKFDPAGNWAIVRTREVPAKGFEGLNKEEREEISRVENEDREVRGK